MICGHCKRQGTTVAHVRACSRGAAPVAGLVAPAASLHSDPCVCTGYDYCQGVRMAHAAQASTHNEAQRRLHWAYND